MVSKQIFLVTPVYNDWPSFAHLVDEIDRALAGRDVEASLIAVDDGSTETLHAPASTRTGGLRRIEILHLARNLGHQRAIAIGLAHVSQNYHPDAVIVLDSDGEDRPESLPQLIEAWEKSDQIVFARRGRRQEGPLFAVFYAIYRILFQFLTGRSISFGNFCIIPGRVLDRVVALPEIWNHFAAGVMRSGLPHSGLVIPRGARYAGRSKMNFVGLILHGLSAISVYMDVLAVRLILFTLVVIAVILAGGIALLYIRYFTPLAIPGWATTVMFGLVTLLFQALMFLTLISFLVLNSRSGPLFIPTRHYADYVIDREVVFERA